jgi:multidrug resistance efflux pump
MTDTTTGDEAPLDLHAVRDAFERTDALLDSLEQRLAAWRINSSAIPQDAIHDGPTAAEPATPAEPEAASEPEAAAAPPIAGANRQHWGVMLLIGIGFLGSCGTVLSRMPASLQVSAPAVPFDTTMFSGTIKPANQITIAAPQGAVVRGVLVRIGETVSVGQPLVAIDDRSAREAVQAAELEYQAATQQVTQVERNIAMLDRSLASLATDLTAAIGRVSLAQRDAEQVPMRQWRDSPQRSQAAFDLAAAKLERARRLREAGAISEQDFEEIEVAARIAENDLENARRWETAARQLQRAQEEQARLQLDRSRAEYRQQREDYVAQMGQARVQLDRARQRLEAAQRLLDDESVRATAAGVVVEVPVGVGDRVAAGATLVRLATLDELLVEVPVAASLVNVIRVGQPVTVMLPTIPPRQVDGSIATINPIPAANMTHLVEVRFENQAGVILSGQPAEIVFK